MRFLDDPTTRTDDLGYLATVFFPHTLLITAIALFGTAAFAPIANKDAAATIGQAGMLALGAAAGLASPALGQRRREDSEPPIEGPPSGAFPAQDPDQ